MSSPLCPSAWRRLRQPTKDKWINLLMRSLMYEMCSCTLKTCSCFPELCPRISKRWNRFSTYFSETISIWNLRNAKCWRKRLTFWDPRWRMMACSCKPGSWNLSENSEYLGILAISVLSRAFVDSLEALCLDIHNSQLPCNRRVQTTSSGHANVNNRSRLENRLAGNSCNGFSWFGKRVRAAYRCFENGRWSSSDPIFWVQVATCLPFYLES